MLVSSRMLLPPDSRAANSRRCRDGCAYSRFDCLDLRVPRSAAFGTAASASPSSAWNTRTSCCAASTGLMISAGSCPTSARTAAATRS